MTSQAQRQKLQYRLTLMNVRMKVRFPCKMKIQHQGVVLSHQVSPHNDTFSFNQQIVLEGSKQKELELTLNLVTQMGSKYLAGIVRLHHEDMFRAEGNCIKIQLIRCMDSQAYCELTINKIMNRNQDSSPNAFVPNIKKSYVRHPGSRQFDEIERSPTIKNIHHLRHLNARTEYEYPMDPPDRESPDWGVNSRLQPITQKPSPKHSNNQSNRWGRSTDRKEISQTQEGTYKQAYIRLKEKYKKQSEQWTQQINKRLEIENRQNNMKLEIVRHRLKVQQQQKMIADKQNLEDSLHQRNIIIQQLSQQIQQKDSLLKQLQSQIKEMQCRLEQISIEGQQAKRIEMFKRRESELKTQMLENQLQSKEKKLALLRVTAEEKIKDQQNQLDSIKKKLRVKQKQKDELEKKMNDTVFELQANLLKYKSMSSEQLEKERNSMQKMEIRLAQLGDKKHELQTKVTQLELIVQRKGYEIEMTYRHSEHLKTDLEESRQRAERYQQMLIINRRLNDEKRFLEKTVQKLKDYQEDQQLSKQQEIQFQLNNSKMSFQENERKLEKMTRANTQLQKELLLAKQEIQKTKKYINTCQQQLKEAKQAQHEAKRRLHTKQNTFYSAETEHASLKQKMKNIDQIYQLQIDKVTSQHEKTQKILKEEKKNMEQFEEKTRKLQIELGKRQTQLSHLNAEGKKQSQEKHERIKQLEQNIRQYEQKLLSLGKSCQHYRKSQKQAIFKMQSIQLDSMQKDEKIQKLKKQNKMLNQKYLQQQQILTAKVSELVEISQERQFLAESLKNTEEELKQLRLELQHSTSHTINLASTINQLKQELSTLQHSYANIEATLKQKESKDDSINMQLRSYLTQKNSLELKVNIFRKQGSRFRDQITELMTKNQNILTKSNTSSIKLCCEDDCDEDQFSFNQFYSTLNVHFKEVRQFCQQQKQQISKLENNLTIVNNQRSKFFNQKHVQLQTLRNQLAQVEQQFQTMLQQKKTELERYGQIISQLHQRITQSQASQNDLNNQVQELTFTISSTKLDAQAMTNEANRRNVHLKKYNAQLEEQNNQLMLLVRELETRVSQCEGQIYFVNANLQEQLELGLRKEKVNQQLKQQLELMKLTVSELRSNKKQLIQKINQLQISLSDKTDQCQNIQHFLSQQERKHAEMKQFVSKMNKDKEAAIKKQLSMGQQIIQLESSNLLKGKQNNMLIEKCDKLTKTNESLKETNKKLLNANKSQQGEIQYTRFNLAKIEQKLKQSENTLKSKEVQLKELQTRLKVTTDKDRQQICSLENQLQMLQQKYDKQLYELRSKNSHLTQQHEKDVLTISKLERKSQEIELTKYEQHQKIVLLEEELTEKDKYIDDLKSKIEDLDSNINELNDELRVSQQKLFDFSGKKFTLENTIRSLLEQKQQELANLDQQFTNRYEATCEEYEYKIDVLTKEKQYFRKELEQKERELARKNIEIKSGEEREINTRKHFQQKIKKIDQDRLNFNANKNLQLQKINDENRQLNDQLNRKQVQNRRLTSEVDTLRRSLTNLEYKMKQCESKLDSQKRQYNVELEQMKRKQIQNRNYRENINTRQWNMQRQIKKHLQNLSRNYLELHDPADSNKVVELIRSFQVSVIEAVTLK